MRGKSEHLSWAFILTLKGWVIASWVIEISCYSMGHGLKWVASLFLVGSHMTRSTLSFSAHKMKQNSSNFDPAGWKKKTAEGCCNFSLSVMYLLCHPQKYTHSLTTVCVFLEATIDPLADAYRLHPPLWPSRRDSIEIDTQSRLVIRDKTQDTAILMETCVMKSCVQLMEYRSFPYSLTFFFCAEKLNTK